MEQHQESFHSLAESGWRGVGGQEEFWSILDEVFSSEQLLQAQLVTNRAYQFVTALEWEGNTSIPCAAQPAAQLILNAHNS